MTDVAKINAAIAEEERKGFFFDGAAQKSGAIREKDKQYRKLFIYSS